jgi:23S rRNA A2030 N6-methylase RlmJ
MALTFGRHLEALVLKRFPSRRQFIIAAEGKARAQAGVAYFSQVVAGKRPPPWERLDAWGRTLKLEGAELRRFRNLAAIAWLPEGARQEFREMLGRLETAERDGH